MSSYRYFATKEGLDALRKFVNSLNQSNISSNRSDLHKSLDGNCFFPTLTWPRDIQLLYNHTPMSDRDTFKFILFMFGNGCPPELCMKFLCTSYFYDRTRMNRRLYQIRWICSSLQDKAHHWHYFDIDCLSRLYLNGHPLSQS